MKKKHTLGKRIGKRPLAPGITGRQILDRLLLPRIEQYAVNNNYTDVDEVIDYLRRTYKEYQRRQLPPFRTMVTRAINTLQRKDSARRPELQLQVRWIDIPGSGSAALQAAFGGGVVCYSVHLGIQYR